MTMEEAIKNFPKQFLFIPKVQNIKRLKKSKKFIVVGMGGSHLAADLIKVANPNFNILIHNNYGLPNIPSKQLKEYLVIFNSYSGNTEEVVSAFKIAIKQNLSSAAISTGGKLLKLARHYQIPYIQLPNIGIQPRSALGFSLRAFLKIMGKAKEFQQTTKLSSTLKPWNFKNKGKLLAKKLRGFVPIIYSSQRNAALAYNWKIKFNETGKIPAFCNVLPELNHNEMTGFDIKATTKKLSRQFYFIFLEDETDYPRIKKRMKILRVLFKKRKLPTEIIKLKSKNVWEKIFNSLILADWTSLFVAKEYGTEPEAVPMVEKFKALMEK
ncbi:hypothetical protein J7J81_00080 [bacterium]|nr:hypothetical protein [bacterium]